MKLQHLLSLLAGVIATLLTIIGTGWNPNADNGPDTGVAKAAAPDSMGLCCGYVNALGIYLNDAHRDLVNAKTCCEYGDSARSYFNQLRIQYYKEALEQNCYVDSLAQFPPVPDCP